MAKQFLNVKGKTVDGRLVVGGIYSLCSTTGLPLADVVRKLRDHDLVVDLDEFCRNASRDNWNPKTILPRIMEAVKDANLHG